MREIGFLGGRPAANLARFALPALILAVFVAGYVPIVQVWLGTG